MKATTIDLPDDSILKPSLDKRNDVYMWGLGGDNQLPSIIEYLALESPTTKACVGRNLNAVIGEGFTAGDTVVHPSGTTLNQLLRQVARSMVLHSNAFLHITYDGNLAIKGIKFINAKGGRVGKADDKEYSGKIVIADWTAKRIDNKSIIDVYNPNKKVIQAQVEKAGGITNYLGQILHITKDTSFIYAPSDLHPALEDAEMEKLSKVLRNNNTKFGFLNAKAVIIPKATDEEKRVLTNKLKNMQGADKAANVILLEANGANLELEKQFAVMDLADNPDDEILSYSDSMAETNICKAFGVPVALVSAKSEGIFGNSGELLKEMQSQLYAQQEYTRSLIEENINNLLSRMADPLPKQSIIDPFAEAVEDDTPKDVNAEAQATLKGSVGGVQALLSIQQSVSQELTSYSSGVAIIMNIFGYDEQTAKAMLGQPKTTEI